MNNYTAGFSDFYNRTAEAYRNINNRTKTKIELYALAGIAAISLYITLPQ